MLCLPSVVLARLQGPTPTEASGFSLQLAVAVCIVTFRKQLEHTEGLTKVLGVHIWSLVDKGLTRLCIENVAGGGGANSDFPKCRGG